MTFSILLSIMDIGNQIDIFHFIANSILEWNLELWFILIDLNSLLTFREKDRRID